MIKSFANRTTEAIFHGDPTHEIHKSFSSELVKMAERRLDLLNCADSLEMLRAIPSMGAEAGVRDGRGKYSIPLAKNWRLCFRWNGDAEDVEIKQ